MASTSFEYLIEESKSETKECIQVNINIRFVQLSNNRKSFLQPTNKTRHINISNRLTRTESLDIAEWVKWNQNLLQKATWSSWKSQANITYKWELRNRIKHNKDSIVGQYQNFQRILHTFKTSMPQLVWTARTKTAVW